ncbi:MAG: hypothetical protein HY318_15305 [Armatimonadetes bacterium]|nr:hypothetical protein [Armatimonadota bacterium]
MACSDKAQIGILRGQPRNPFAFYVSEILAEEGFTYQWVEKDFGGDVLILPSLWHTPEFVRDWVAAGRNLLALRPPPDLLPLFGLRSEMPRPFTWSDRYLRRGEGKVLQYHGPADLLETAGCESVASLQPAYGEAPSSHPAVVRVEEGARRVAYTFDLAQSTVLFRQGRSDQASTGTNPDPDGDGVFRPGDFFVNFLDPRLKGIPQADLHIDLFLELIDWLAEKGTPIPRVWRFPFGQPCVAVLNGDSDGCAPGGLHLAFDLAEEHGARYSLYLMKEQFDSLSSKEVSDLKGRGHDVGLHPWHGSQPTVEEMRLGLLRDYSTFQDHYGYVPTNTRHHSVVTAGWTETQETLAQIGVRLDLNFCPGRGFQWGFINGSARSMRMSRADGTILDLYQHSTLTTDDGILTDKTGLPALSVDDAILLSERLIAQLHDDWQGVYLPYFHPIYFEENVPFTKAWYEAVLLSLRERGIPGLTGEAWVQFNDTRRRVSLHRHGEGWGVETPEGAQGLTLLLPERCREVTVDGQAQPLKAVNWGGTKGKCLVLPERIDRSPAILGIEV